MWRQNNLINTSCRNVANVIQIAFCPYFDIQIAISLAELRQVAGGTRKSFVPFQDPGVTSNETSIPKLYWPRGCTWTARDCPDTRSEGAPSAVAPCTREDRNIPARTASIRLVSTDGYNTVLPTPRRCARRLPLRVGSRGFAPFFRACACAAECPLSICMCMSLCLSDSFKMYWE